MHTDDITLVETIKENVRFVSVCIYSPPYQVKYSYYISPQEHTIKGASSPILILRELILNDLDSKWSNYLYQLMLFLAE